VIGILDVFFSWQINGDEGRKNHGGVGVKPCDIKDQDDQGGFKGSPSSFSPAMGADMLMSGCDGQYRLNVTIDCSGQVQIKGQMRFEELCTL
jgi:hypothetical protein